eukprot:s25_g5.t1
MTFADPIFEPGRRHLAEEEEKEALEGPQEMEEEAPSEAETSDGESSNDSGFAVNAKAFEKKRPKTAAPSAPSRKPSAAAAAPVSSQAPSTPTPAVKAKTGEKVEEKAISRGSAAYAALADWFTPLAYWQGNVRSKDVDQKVNKVVEASAALGGMSSPEAVDLVSKLTKLSQTVTRQTEVMDLVALFRNDTTSATEHVKGIEGHTMETLSSFPSDCITAMLTEIGRAIIEARCWVIRISPDEACGASGSVPVDFDAKFFFSFMSLDGPKTSGLTFTNLRSQGCSMDQAAFLQLQCALLHHWVDKFKTLSEDGTVKLLATIPSELHGPELIRTDVLFHNLDLLCSVSGPGHAEKIRRAILWRNLWTKAIGLSKRSMDEKEASQKLETSAKHVASLTALLSQAGEYETKAEQVQPILAAARACCRAFDVHNACKDIVDEDVKAKCSSLDDNLEACGVVMKDRFGNTSYASTFFQSLFMDSKDPFPFPETEEFDSKILLRELIIEGRLVAA